MRKSASEPRRLYTRKDAPVVGNVYRSTLKDATLLDLRHDVTCRAIEGSTQIEVRQRKQRRLREFHVEVFSVYRG